ncbi:hypothetical protein AVEN_224611-1 [Araneus ventricosus]|uniref:Uncharacterized protein n=1 Tax=Araneus ventricosus TaxID=182803 RepID=A0A4Y2RVV9_ARAVE|nr:hypothetical protein AVEN_224611-1 [Araneus ventricosus]
MSDLRTIFTQNFRILKYFHRIVSTDDFPNSVIGNHPGNESEIGKDMRLPYLDVFINTEGRWPDFMLLTDMLDPFARCFLQLVFSINSI